MQVETLIYIYGAVCLSMIVFNISYIFVMKVREPRSSDKNMPIADEVGSEIFALKQGGEVSPRHLKSLRRKLRKIRQLIGFNLLLEQVREKEGQELYIRYITQLQPVFLSLSVFYLNREVLQAGYFSWFLSKHAARRKMPIDMIRDVLLKYVERENLYCRINALSGFYGYGDEEYVVKALKVADDGKVFLHEKIITEGLISFEGSHKKLIGRLWQEFDCFSVRMQLAILNYIRFLDEDFQEEMLDIMTDEKRHKELRLGAIRYFGKHPYDKALEYLIAFGSSTDQNLWEYATVSLWALEAYDEERVVEIFKDCLHSNNWYIRSAAATALENHGEEYNDLLDIMEGRDRYAKEMMMYHLESKKLRRKEGKA